MKPVDLSLIHEEKEGSDEEKHDGAEAEAKVDTQMTINKHPSVNNVLLTVEDSNENTAFIKQMSSNVEKDLKQDEQEEEVTDDELQSELVDINEEQIVVEHFQKI